MHHILIVYASKLYYYKTLNSWEQISPTQIYVGRVSTRVLRFSDDIKATEVWLLATSAGHLKYWRYGKTREFRVKIWEFFGAKFNFIRNSRVLPYRLCITFWLYMLQNCIITKHWTVGNKYHQHKFMYSVNN
jgi:hypothetical protein